MYHGDRSRKEVLVAYGFRLPSALDNRPLNFEEWEIARRPAAVRVGHAGALRAPPVGRRRRRADHPSDRPGRSGHRRAAGPRTGRRSAGGDPRSRVTRRARPRHDADQAHGRGPDAVLPGAGRQGPLPALRHRHARAHRDPARPAARRRSTCWSASTCCAKGSICRKCRSSRSWTPTRRVSCGRPGRSSRPSAARRATSTAGRSCTPTRMTDSMRQAIGETDRRREIQEAYNRRARHHARLDRQEHRRGA